MPEPGIPAIGALSNASKRDLCTLAQCYRNFGLASTARPQEVFNAPRVSAPSGNFGLNRGFVSDFSVHVRRRKTADFSNAAHLRTARAIMQQQEPLLAITSSTNNCRNQARHAKRVFSRVGLLGEQSDSGRYFLDVQPESAA
eukprot:7266493-Pyramimonas_sp.AAC.1